MSEYADLIKRGMKRVAKLTQDYEACLKNNHHAMAAVVRGELTTARAYLQGLSDAGEQMLKAQLEDNTTFFKEADDE